ncbi:hypothetical protein BDN70DRAFT_820674, partial [Pholiota conissans]
IWRCRDCTFPRILCRRCMRVTHRENPLHRVECWNGQFFQRAHLREVGTYLLNSYVCVVHTNGLHDICLVYCTCQGIENGHADLMFNRFVPSTFDKYSTLFTTAVLDDFRMANLEMKASTYQYFQALRRKTNPTNPMAVPSRYRELLRMSRQWRSLKKLKWSGFGHTGSDYRNPIPGELTLFCPACPQPNINLPANWAEDHDRCD